MGSDESAKSTDVMELKELSAKIIMLEASSMDTAAILDRLVPEVASLISCKATLSDHLIDTNSRLDSVVKGQVKTNKNLERISIPFNNGVGFLKTTKFFMAWGGALVLVFSAAVALAIKIITLYAKYNDDFVQVIIDASIG